MELVYYENWTGRFGHSIVPTYYRMFQKCPLIKDQGQILKKNVPTCSSANTTVSLGNTYDSVHNMYKEG